MSKACVKGTHSGLEGVHKNIHKVLYDVVHQLHHKLKVLYVHAVVRTSFAWLLAVIKTMLFLYTPSRLFGSVAKSCMQKQPQTRSQCEEGVAHEMT